MSINKKSLIGLKDQSHQYFNHYILLCSFILLLISACSTPPKQPTACDKNLAHCQTKLLSSQENLKQCQKNLNSISTRRDQLAKHLEECQLSAAEILSNKEAARVREAELRQLLEKELGDKNVEIEFLKGRLTVRMLNRIMFNSGSADILPSGQEVLDKLVKALVNTRDTIRVVGHTDNVSIGASLLAKYPSNWELSAARAASVVRYFEGKHRIQSTRMEAVGLSKYHPLEKNDSAENRQRNRRVEIILTAKE